jgi:hypothetical protein
MRSRPVRSESPHRYQTALRCSRRRARQRPSRAPVSTRSTVAVVGLRMAELMSPLDHSKAESELGWKPEPVESPSVRPPNSHRRERGAACRRKMRVYERSPESRRRVKRLRARMRTEQQRGFDGYREPPLSRIRARTVMTKLDLRVRLLGRLCPRVAGRDRRPRHRCGQRPLARILS